jgi:hypothetical protein
VAPNLLRASAIDTAHAECFALPVLSNWDGLFLGLVHARSLHARYV